MTLGRRRESSGELDEEEYDGAPLVGKRVVVVAVGPRNLADALEGEPRLLTSARLDVKDAADGDRARVLPKPCVAPRRGVSAVKPDAARAVHAFGCARLVCPLHNNSCEASHLRKPVICKKE